ncbi:hypothetical protein [Halosegnis marinus]|uniref:transcriptional regulator FilR1 domain-containing protein n=1 Tax=Halosegnis marinus TaxID=3034023 RepID=UPI00361DBE7D
MADTVDAAAALLNHLPTDAPRDHRFLAGAESVGMDDRSPAEVLGRMRVAVGDSDRFRGAAFSANDDGFIETVYRRSVVEGATEVRFVATPAPARYVATEFPDLVAGILDSDAIEVRVAPSMPFACYLATADGETTGYLGVHGEHDNFLGFVANDRPGAVAWLESVYAERWTAAAPFADFLADEGLSP